MSLAVKHAMLASKGLGKNERFVLLAIAAHTNSAGDAWPSVATIADYADCSERTVQRALVKLINLGKLTWRQAPGKPTRVYRIATAGQAPPAIQSFVYFVDYGPTVKIGYSKDPVKRLAQLKEQAGRGDLRILATEVGDEDWEAVLHEEFADHRIGRSEQFLKTPALMDYIESLAGGIR